MQSRPKILLTGASGFLGSAIQKALSDSYTIASLGRGGENDYALDLSEVVPTFNEKFQMVIHAAGKAHVIPRNAREANEFFNVNLNGTQNLIQGLQITGQLPLHFVFISTVAVYGRDTGSLIEEVENLNGYTAYAKSKIQAEARIQSWASENQIRLTILRLPLVVGEYPPGNLGSMVKMMRKRLYIGIGSGTTQKSMVLAEDVANFIPSVAVIGGIYNLTDGFHPTLLALESAIAAQLKRKDPLRLPDPVLRSVARVGDLFGDWFPINTNRFKKLTSSLTFSDQKARKLAGWNPRSTIDYLPRMI